MKTHAIDAYALQKNWWIDLESKIQESRGGNPAAAVETTAFFIYTAKTDEFNSSQRRCRTRTLPLAEVSV